MAAAPFDLRELAPPARTALVVGTVLCLVNDTFSRGSAARIAMNYVVPFLVATYSRLRLRSDMRRRSADCLEATRKE